MGSTEKLVSAIDKLTNALSESSRQANRYNLILGILTAVLVVFTLIMVWKLFNP